MHGCDATLLALVFSSLASNARMGLLAGPAWTDMRCNHAGPAHLTVCAAPDANDKVNCQCPKCQLHYNALETGNC